jgi:hypothetical protein
LKASAEGGDRDKWMALADWGRATMAETPQYAGESVVNIAARTGEKPLAALKESMKDQTAANLKYLQADLNADLANEAFKTKAEQSRFTNILALKAADAQIRNADAAWLKAKMGPKGVRSRKISEDDLNMSKAFLTNLVTPGAESEKLLERVSSLNFKIKNAGQLKGYLERMANDNTVIQILAHEAESFKTNYFNVSRQTEEASKADIEKHMIGVLIEIMGQNPEEHDSHYIGRLLDSWMQG